MLEPITSFTGEYRFLSNFYPARVSAVCGLVLQMVPTVEHAYQASKAESLSDFFKICSANSPAEAKRLGRTIKIRPDFEKIKDYEMLIFLRMKFAHQDLKEKLLATGDRKLIEGNDWGDFYWGVCNGKGLNRLGNLLMQVRKELQANNEI